MTQLGVSGARDHPPNIAEPLIAAQASRLAGEAEPDLAARLDPGGKRAIVDQRAAHAGDAADAVERAAADQHAATGRAGDAPTRIVDPGEGIEHGEEEDEGGNERALGEGL